MDRALHLHDGNNGRPHRATETGEESMSKQQQLELDATLRQGQFDLGADFRRCGQGSVRLTPEPS